MSHSVLALASLFLNLSFPHSHSFIHTHSFIHSFIRSSFPQLFIHSFQLPSIVHVCDAYLYLLLLAYNHAHCIGRSLSASVVMMTIKELHKVRTPDHQIGYDRWLITAKENLKWNDYCIQLFWDMLQAAVRCKDETKNGWELESDLIEIEYLSLFLALHIPDATPRQVSPVYDTMWPHEGGGTGGSGNADGIPLSPTKSPHGSPRKHFFNVPTGGGSPRFTTYHPCICVHACIHTYIHENT